MDIFQKLPGYLVLSGSRGFGTPNENSDYDFYVPENKWEMFKKWFFNFATENGLVVDSCVVGHLSFRLGDKGPELFEFSYLFPKNKKEYEERK